MRKPIHGLSAILLTVLIACGCHAQRGVEPVNRRPVITGLTALPDTLNPSDSCIVFCEARDPDGDTLVYDWRTDARLTLEGDPLHEGEVFATRSNTHKVFNANLANPINDSAWVQCFAHDRRGLSDNRFIYVLLRRPSSNRPAASFKIENATDRHHAPAQRKRGRATPASLSVLPAPRFRGQATAVSGTQDQTAFA